ncbi:FAD-dependent oxidoreductase [Candidatus Poribacteria bacterium]
MKTQIPLVNRADVLIVEGTLVGYSLACQLARRGLRVVLTMSSTSPVEEISTCLRPWIHSDILASVPAPLGAIFQDSLKQETPDDELMLHMGDFTDKLEDLLIDTGISFYYDAHPAALLKDESGIAGVVFGGKFGLNTIMAPYIIDCTAIATVAHLAGADFRLREPDNPDVHVKYAMYCGEPPEQKVIPLEADDGVDGEIRMHGSFAEFCMTIPANLETPFGIADLNVDMRRALLRIGERLRANGDFQTVRGGDAFLISPIWKLVSQGSSGQRLSSLQPAGIDGMLVVSPAADLSDQDAADLQENAGSAVRLANDLADGILDDQHRVSSMREGVSSEAIRVVFASEMGDSLASAQQARFTDPSFREPGALALEVDLPDIPVALHTDVLVAGAGTSGVPAAKIVAQEGLDTVCLDKHSDAGGTNTIGGVPNFWYGRQTPHFKSIRGSLQDTRDKTGMPFAIGDLALMLKAGVRVLPKTPFAGVLAEQREIKAVLAVTPRGLVAITANTFIDASGDGDLAAWAGADYTYGNERDESTLWYSFGKFQEGHGTRASRHYRTVADQRSLSDLTRAMIIGRRQIGILGITAEYPQFYLAPRESRHIQGRATVTYSDLLTQRHRQDKLIVSESNFDIKGMASSDLAMTGFIEPVFRGLYVGDIPYPAILPRDLDNVLVIGKAYSATHDAESMARMQPDLMDLGGAAAVALVQSRKLSKPLAEIDMEAFQQALVAQGILAESDLQDNRSSEVSNARETELKGLMDLLTSEGADLRIAVYVDRGSKTEPSPFLCSEARVLLYGQSAVNELRSALDSIEADSRTVIAMMLCYLRDPSGAPTLLAALEEALGSNDLSLPVGSLCSHLDYWPNHGWMPESAYMINALALAGESRVIPLLLRVVDRLELEPDKNDYQFCYVHAISYAMERLADPEGIPALERLLDDPAIRGHVLPRGSDPRRCVDHIYGRYGYLELCLARALARCGLPRGYQILINYLDDQRLYLSRSALNELMELSDQDFGFSIDDWRNWLANVSQPLPRKPYFKEIE